MSGLQQLSAMMWQLIADKRCCVSGTQVDVPTFVPADTAIVDGRFQDYPVLRHLEHTLEDAEAEGFGTVVQAYRAVADEIRYSQNSSYNETNCPRQFLDGYAYGVVSGPGGPVLCEAPRGGFLIMGPDVFYPDHHHKAREVYLILSGHAKWRLDKGDWFDVGPGDMIYHDSWMWHAMQTADEPILTYAGWIEPGERSSISFGDAATD